MPDHRRNPRLNISSTTSTSPWLLLFVFDLFQQFCDADALFDRFVVIEAEFGYALEMVQALAQGAADEACSGSEALESFPALSGVAQHRDEDMAVAKVGRDFHGRHRDQSDPRILNFAFDDLTELNTDLLSDSVDSSSVHPNRSNNLDVALDRAFRRDPLRLF